MPEPPPIPACSVGQFTPIQSFPTPLPHLSHSIVGGSCYRALRRGQSMLPAVEGSRVSIFAREKLEPSQPANDPPTASEWAEHPGRARRQSKVLAARMCGTRKGASRGQRGREGPPPPVPELRGMRVCRSLAVSILIEREDLAQGPSALCLQGALGQKEV